MASVSATEHTLSAAMTFAPSISRLDEASFWLLATASALKSPRCRSRSSGRWPSAQPVFRARLRPALGMLLSRSTGPGNRRRHHRGHGLIADTTLRYLQDRAGFVTGCV